LYVRQIAWLSCKPGEKAKESRAETIEKENPDSAYLVLPEILDCGNLLDYLKELGFDEKGGGFGAVPLTFQEIHSWAALTRTILTAWEVLALRKLSAAFVDQCRLAAKPDCPAPWQGYVDPTPEIQTKVSNFFAAFLDRKRSEGKVK
jgi:hypothetical protein